MNSRERLLAAVHHEQPDMVPVGIHNIATYLPYLRRVIGRSMGDLEALKMFGLDIALYRGYSQTAPLKGDGTELAYEPPAHFKGAKWREREEVISRTNGEKIVRRTMTTPKGRLSTVERRTEITCWTLEPLLKKPEDLDLLRYRPTSYPDPEGYQKEFGTGFKEGIIRVGVWGQGEAVILRGSKELIKDFHIRPDWVKEMYELLTEWAIAWIDGLPSDYVDLVEVAGHIGAFVSPEIYSKQIMPFDKIIVKAAHDKGFPTSYHDCGLVMHILDLIARTGTDCVETLTPPPFGGDVDLAKAKSMVGDRVCLIGGFHQSLLERGTIQAIDARVRECIDSAAEGGSYILYNNDHFFEAPPENIHAYVEAARRYGRYC